MNFKPLLLALAAGTCLAAHAADSLDLSRYSVTGTYGLDLAAGSVSGLEASAVTFARDRGTLFYVGDEGTGVVEISTTGQTLGSMAFNWAGTATTNQDTEGLTYLGGGVLGVLEERLQDVYRFSYSNGGTAALASSYASISDTTVGNNGLEGISYDPRDGSFVTVKQQSPQNITAGALTFSATGGSSTMTQMFDPALLGVTTLSDVQTLAPIDALAGSAAADHLLVLSLGSRRLLEVTRAGVIKSSLDLSGILASNAFEGVTVDQFGTIYLVAEQIQDGSNLPLDPNPKSMLVVLTAPVPEPQTYALMLAGLSVVAVAVRRQRSGNAGRHRRPLG